MRTLLKEEKTDVSKIKDETGKIWYCVNTDASGNADRIIQSVVFVYCNTAVSIISAAQLLF